MPTAAKVAQTMERFAAPSRMVNSPMKPLSAGSPIDDSAAIRNSVAYIGICLASPPYSEINRVCRRS